MSMSLSPFKIWLVKYVSCIFGCSSCRWVLLSHRGSKEWCSVVSSIAVIAVLNIWMIANTMLVPKPTLPAPSNSWSCCQWWGCLPYSELTLDDPGWQWKDNEEEDSIIWGKLLISTCVALDKLTKWRFGFQCRTGFKFWHVFINHWQNVRLTSKV